MTDRAATRHPLAACVEAAAAAGVDWIQVRDRTLAGEALCAHAAALRDAAVRGAGSGRRPSVLLNRRADVALALGLDGVHLGFDALPPEAARALLGPDALLGASAHTPDEACRAAADGLSYLHLAPVFGPLSKPGGRTPLGLGALAEAAACGIPVLAQGGMEANNAAAAIQAGAAGVAVTGAILLADDPGAAAAALRDALDAAGGAPSAPAPDPPNREKA